jgi:hypothetical protein
MLTYAELCQLEVLLSEATSSALSKSLASVTDLLHRTDRIGGGGGGRRAAVLEEEAETRSVIERQVT